MCAVKVGEAAEDCFCDFSEDIDADGTEGS
jgi:hypothetical protein